MIFRSVTGYVSHRKQLILTSHHRLQPSSWTCLGELFLEGIFVAATCASDDASDPLFA